MISLFCTSVVVFLVWSLEVMSTSGMRDFGNKITQPSHCHALPRLSIVWLTVRFRNLLGISHTYINTELRLLELKERAYQVVLLGLCT